MGDTYLDTLMVLLLLLPRKTSLVYEIDKVASAFKRLRAPVMYRALYCALKERVTRTLALHCRMLGSCPGVMNHVT